MLGSAGDWLQGPYVYALYQHYGYGKGEIGRLFIAGFGSSMVLGTVAGALGDRYGRKKACMAYCVTYGLSCVTKHWSDYGVLMLGRVLGGIATSLLFSAFESWLVAESHKRGVEEQHLSATFAKASFYGNGLASIVSGLAANSLAAGLSLGPVAPFDAAIVCVSLALVAIAAFWPDNFGDKGASQVYPDAHLSRAVAAITSDRRILLLGAVQSLFEASMYAFVFLWTPALSPSGQPIPHGMVFATFMLASMVGSSLANTLMARKGARPERYLAYVFTLSAACLAVPILLSFLGAPPSATSAGVLPVPGKVELAAFVAFEGCVGIFWPSIMQLRAQYLPEEVRSAIINLFRVPLNAFVCVILYKADTLALNAIFGLCCAFLLLASVLQRRLYSLSSVSPLGRTFDISEPDSMKA